MSKRKEPEAAPEPHVLTYFGIFGKGPSIALALAHSDLAWRVEFPADWAGMKPSAPWGHLPLLDVPGGARIGHEFAILNYIAKVGGGEASDDDYAASQQVTAASSCST